MILISHRGNLSGPNPQLENEPKYIIGAIERGFHVEIDVWYFKDSGFWLGHDEPQYQVTWNWFFKRQDNLWLHCKNAQAAKDCQVFQSFCHTGDPYSYTSKKFREGDSIVFGSETKGIDEQFLRANWEKTCTIPMMNNNIRSLNLATSVGIVLYEALRQNGKT